MAHDVCVIGAGWSGLTAAVQLQSAGLDVVVVEKARGPGGRCATRREDGFAFDHGGQYFTARAAEFAEAVDEWKRRGLVAAWEPRIRVFGQRPKLDQSAPSERLVALPGMNGVLKHLAAPLDCRFGWRAERLSHDAAGWTIGGGEGADPVRAASLVLTAPPKQAADLLHGVSDLADRIAQVPMSPCWALMLGFEHPLEVDFDAAFDNRGPLSWLARNSSKPGRGAESWVAHAGAEWSSAHLEEAAADVAQTLLDAFRKRVPAAAEASPAVISAHRWRYALAPEPINQACLADRSRALVVAGDWCAGNRIEGAWHSGRAAAEALLGG